MKVGREDSGTKIPHINIIKNLTIFTKTIDCGGSFAINERKTPNDEN